MVKILRSWAAPAVVLALTGCATPQAYLAAGDVHGFLLAVRDDDRAAFEAHVDRPALEAQLQARLVDEARARNSRLMQGAALLFSGPAARLAGQALVRPEVFRAVAEYYGYRPDQPIPGQMAIAATLKPAGNGRVCASGRRGGPCVLVFADEAGTWRLIGFAGETSMLRSPQ